MYAGMNTRRWIGPSGALALLIALGGCDSTTEPNPQWSWEITLEAADGGELTGSAGVISNPSNLAAAVVIEGAEPEESYAWWIAEGSCDEPGDAVGELSAYPALDTDGDGEAGAEVTLARGLNPDHDFHVAVGQDVDGEVEIRACGDLI